MDISQALKAGCAFAWPERPQVGSEVQINSGSSWMKIIRFEGDVAVCRNETGELYDFHYLSLRPWRVH